MNLHERPMQEFDIDSVYAIELASHISPWGRDILRDCVLIGYDCRVFELVDNASTVYLAGYIMARISENQCHILNLCLAKQFQLQGLGRKFLERYLESLSFLPELKTVVLEVRKSNAIALHLYNTLGFKQVQIKENYYRDSDGTEDAVYLEKLISPPSTTTTTSSRTN